MSVWAVNEYGAIGSTSSISVTISDINCRCELYYLNEIIYMFS